MSSEWLVWLASFAVLLVAVATLAFGLWWLWWSKVGERRSAEKHIAELMREEARATESETGRD